MKQIFLILLILIGLGGVASAKMLKLDDNVWLNKDSIHELERKGQECKIITEARRAYMYESTCEELMKKLNIEVID
jgi:hypothetical protein